MKHIQWIGAGCGSGAQDCRTSQGPRSFFAFARQNLEGFSDLEPIHLHEEPSGELLRALAGVANFNLRLARLTARSEAFACVVGGDHSCAIGTWSGIASRSPDPLGLLWIDAHMDAHTIDSTASGAIHGMPLAVLLGEGHPSLTSIQSLQPKIHAPHSVLFGVRSYEPEEKILLTQHGIRIYNMNEIRARGFETCWQEAIGIVSQGPFGVTLDLDALDPGEIPAVGSPAPDGLQVNELLQGLSELHPHRHSGRWVGLEIVEYNPELDVDLKTAHFIGECLKPLVQAGGNPLTLVDPSTQSDTPRTAI